MTVSSVDDSNLNRNMAASCAARYILKKVFISNCDNYKSSCLKSKWEPVVYLVKKICGHNKRLFIKVKF